MAECDVTVVADWYMWNYMKGTIKKKTNKKKTVSFFMKEWATEVWLIDVCLEHLMNGETIRDCGKEGF